MFKTIFMGITAGIYILSSTLSVSAAENEFEHEFIPIYAYPDVMNIDDTETTYTADFPKATIEQNRESFTLDDKVYTFPTWTKTNDCTAVTYLAYRLDSDPNLVEHTFIFTNPNLSTLSLRGARGVFNNDRYYFSALDENGESTNYINTYTLTWNETTKEVKTQSGTRIGWEPSYQTFATVNMSDKEAYQYLSDLLMVQTDTPVILNGNRDEYFFPMVLLAPIMAKMETPVMAEIVGLIPIVIPIVVSYLALRKALKTLSATLSQA